MLDAFKTNGTSPPSDLLVHDHGSIFLSHATSQRSRCWIEEQIPEDHQQWSGDLVMEHRFIGDIVRGARSPSR